MLLCALANGHSTPGGDLPESNHSSDWTLVCVQSPAVNLQAAQTVPISMCAASPIQEMSPAQLPPRRVLLTARVKLLSAAGRIFPNPFCR
jgi:hypothetical protein